MRIDITGLDKAEVLAILYNNAKPQGLGFLHYDPKDMTVEEARKALQTETYFDYPGGRVMKVDLSEDTFDPYLYNRDNGEGLAEKLIEELRSRK